MGIEERLQRLEDDRAIRDLKARYLRGCDFKEPETVRDTLLPIGARILFDGFQPFENRDDFTAIYVQMGCQPGIFDMHHGANGVIAFENGKRATGIWSLFFHNINISARTLTQMAVQYDDIYVKDDGRWWIAETRSRCTSCLIHEVEADGRVTVRAMGDPPAAYGGQR